MSNKVQIYQPAQGVSLVDIRMDAQRFPRLRNIPVTQAVAQLCQIVAMAYTYTGRPVDDTRLGVVASALHAELMQDSRGIGTDNITVEEIGHAVRTAVLTAGDMYISIATLFNAICTYCTGEGHDAQVQADNRHRAERERLLADSPAGALMRNYETQMLSRK